MRVGARLEWCLDGQDLHAALSGASLGECFAGCGEHDRVFRNEFAVDVEASAQDELVASTAARDLVWQAHARSRDGLESAQPVGFRLKQVDATREPKTPTAWTCSTWPQGCDGR